MSSLRAAESSPAPATWAAATAAKLASNIDLRSTWRAANRACVLLNAVLASDSDKAKIRERMPSMRGRASTERSPPGANRFVIVRVASGTNRTQAFVTARLPTGPSQSGPST